MVLGLPPSRESVAGPFVTNRSARNSLSGIFSARLSQGNHRSNQTASEEAKPKIEKVTTSAVLAEAAEKPYMLELWKDKLPPHQYKVMSEDPMYKPGIIY